MQSCRGRTRPQRNRGGAPCTEPRPHRAVDQQMRRRAEAQRRRGLAEAEMCGTAGPHGRRRCAGPRGGSSRTSRDAQGHAVPRGREVARGSEVAVAASPRSAPTLREFSRALLCSLFPSLLSFPRSIKPALTRLTGLMLDSGKKKRSSAKPCGPGADRV